MVRRSWARVVRTEGGGRDDGWRVRADAGDDWEPEREREPVSTEHGRRRWVRWERWVHWERWGPRGRWVRARVGATGGVERGEFWLDATESVQRRRDRAAPLAPDPNVPNSEAWCALSFGVGNIPDDPPPVAYIR